VQGATLHGSLKVFSYVVLLLMVAATIYAGFIGVKYWTGIGV
jgi:hypothetical protein